MTHTQTIAAKDWMIRDLEREMLRLDYDCQRLRQELREARAAVRRAKFFENHYPKRGRCMFGKSLYCDDQRHGWTQAQWLDAEPEVT